jgi:hypothetical protein
MGGNNQRAESYSWEIMFESNVGLSQTFVKLVQNKQTSKGYMYYINVKNWDITPEIPDM